MVIPILFPTFVDKKQTVLMKCNKIIASCFCTAVILLAAGCGNDDGGGSITVSGSQTVELRSVINQSQTLTFTADGDWKASCDANWLTFSPKNGKAGTNTITLTTTSTNQTKGIRSARLTISSGSSSKTVTVRQKSDYALFKDEVLTFPAKGGYVDHITFVTNINERSLKLLMSEGLDEWVVSAGQRTSTRAEQEFWINSLNVQPNLTEVPRRGCLCLATSDTDGSYLMLDTLWIRQECIVKDYESTDYSADGRVTQLSQATTGRGITIVMMGDGYTDADIADGTYDRVMDQAVDCLFSEEPIRSLKDYFNIYRVTTVSRNGQCGEGMTTAISCKPDYQSTNISFDNKKVMEYTRKARPDEDIEQKLSVVIVNSPVHNGVTSLYTAKDGKPMNYAICLCTVNKGTDTESFRQVLTHEAIGHGFAKLGDEYVESQNVMPTDEVISEVKQLHRYNWMLNVDPNSDPLKTAWSDFVGLTIYDNEEIGAYEGAYTYSKGMYRPTKTSMMNCNDAPFNAPSRRAIYNKVLRMALDYEPTLDEFTDFDSRHKPTVWHYDKDESQTRNAWMPVRHPCIVWKKWQ